MQLDSLVVEKQEKAGSLANLCPSSYKYREFVDEVKNKDRRKSVDEDIETEEVISVCESESQVQIIQNVYTCTVRLPLLTESIQFSVQGDNLQYLW